MHDTARETAHAIIAARYEKAGRVSRTVVLIPWALRAQVRGGQKYTGGDMPFDDPTLYGRDDETDEFGDAGGFSESLEEDFDEEEEEEEEPAMTEEEDEGAMPEPHSPPEPAMTGGGS